MLEEYKKILRRRREQMAEQVLWTKTISAIFQERGIFSRSDIQEIEMDLNSKHRIFAALSKLTTLTDPSIFEKFRLVLKDCGHLDMAESLEFDRSRIQWDFQREQSASSLSNYIDHLIADLLQPLTAEADEHLRTCRLVEAKNRLESLRNSVRQIQLDRDNFRRDLQDVMIDGLEYPASKNHSPARYSHSNPNERVASNINSQDQVKTNEHNTNKSANHGIIRLGSHINNRNKINDASSKLNDSHISVRSRSISNGRNSGIDHHSNSGLLKNQKQTKLMTLSELEDVESSKDTELLKKMTRTLGSLTSRIQQLEDENCELRSRLQLCTNLSDEDGSLKFLDPTKSGVQYQESGIYEGDMDTESETELQRHYDSDIQYDEEENDVIRIQVNKSKMDQLFSQILSQLSNTTHQSFNQLRKEINSSYGEKLEHLLKETLAELESSKTRSQLLCQAMQDLQRERELIGDSLGLSNPLVSDRNSFTQAVLQRIEELQAFANNLHRSQRPQPPGTYYIRRSVTQVDLEKGYKCSPGGRPEGPGSRPGSRGCRPEGQCCRRGSGDTASTIADEDERKRKTSDPTQQRTISPKLLPLRGQSANRNLNVRINSPLMVNRK